MTDKIHCWNTNTPMDKLFYKTIYQSILIYIYISINIDIYIYINQSIYQSILIYIYISINIDIYIYQDYINQIILNINKLTVKYVSDL